MVGCGRLQPTSSRRRVCSLSVTASPSGRYVPQLRKREGVIAQRLVIRPEHARKEALQKVPGPLRRCFVIHWLLVRDLRRCQIVLAAATPAPTPRRSSVAGSGTEWIGFRCLSFLSFFSAWSFVSTPFEFPFPCPASSTETGTSIVRVNIRTPSRFTSFTFVLLLTTSKLVRCRVRP